MSSPSISKLIAIGGAVLLLVSFFALPWVTFLDPAQVEAQVQEFLKNAHIQEFLDLLPRETLQELDISELRTAKNVQELFKAQDLRDLFAFVDSHPYFTAWNLARDLPHFSDTLAFVLFGVLLVAIVTLVLALVTQFVTGDFARIAKVLGAGIVLLVFVSLLWFVPTLYTLGEPDDFGLNLACMLLGTRTGIGLWLTLLGLLLIGVGWTVDVMFEERRGQSSLVKNDDSGEDY